MAEEGFITILVAEDNDVSRDMMVSLLQTQGYKALPATDGRSAIELIENSSVDMALVDINMAPKGGFDFCRYLLVNGIKLPVVIITADDSSDMLSTASELGVTRVLQKPITPDRLLDTVGRVLKRLGLNPQALAGDAHDTKFTTAQLLQHAIDLADKNAQNSAGGPFAAVVADREGHILGEGTNSHGGRADPTAHAEVMAIRRAAEKLDRTDLGDCILYCASEPTMMGKALIQSVGIEKVYYGLSHDDTGQLYGHARPVDTIYEQMSRDAALKVYDRWQARQPKKR